MINKIKTAQEAVAGVQDGMTIMVGGFLGCGNPHLIIDEIPVPDQGMQRLGEGVVVLCLRIPEPHLEKGSGKVVLQAGTDQFFLVIHGL